MVNEEAGCGTRVSKLRTAVLLRMSCRFTIGEVLGQEGTQGRIATAWLHWGDCVRVVVSGLLRTCRTTIFVDQEETSLEFRRKSEVVTKRKKAVGNTVCMSKPRIGLVGDSGFWDELPGA